MSKILEMRTKFPQTEHWMDSFHVEDHEYGLAQGNTGVTTSSTWVTRMMLNEPREIHEPEIQALKKKYPNYDERAIFWAWTLERAKERHKIMLPMWEKGDPKKGRFSIQLPIYDHNDTEERIKKGLEAHAVGPNIQVKIPATKAGFPVFEELTYRGVNVMTTNVYALEKSLLCAEYIQRGLDRRSAEGLSNDHLNPICAVLLGMQDDWLRGYVEKEKLVIDPDALNYGGIAIWKKVYETYKERNIPVRLLTGYYRHARHWTSFIGGELIMAIPAKWQKRFEVCDVEIKDYMSEPIPAHILNELMKLPPFVKAYTEGSLTIDDFDTFPPVTMTIHYFSETYDTAILRTREYMLPKPL